MAAGQTGPVQIFPGIVLDVVKDMAELRDALQGRRRDAVRPPRGVQGPRASAVWKRKVVREACERNDIPVSALKDMRRAKQAAVVRARAQAVRVLVGFVGYGEAGREVGISNHTSVFYWVAGRVQGQVPEVKRASSKARIGARPSTAYQDLTYILVVYQRPGETAALLDLCFLRRRPRGCRRHQHAPPRARSRDRLREELERFMKRSFVGYATTHPNGRFYSFMYDPRVASLFGLEEADVFRVLREGLERGRDLGILGVVEHGEGALHSRHDLA